VVKLWWICGELWFVDGHFFGVVDFPLFEDLFLGLPGLGRLRFGLKCSGGEG
jgi:hypothetical protein